MQTFSDLYNRLVKASAENRLEEETKAVKKLDFDTHQLDCLLHPEKYSLIWKIDATACDEKNPGCIEACLFNAVQKDEKGNVAINKELCVGCGECVKNCKAQKLLESKDILPAMKTIHDKKPVYAMIAPAFVSQFSRDVTPGKLRSAFKKLGFAGMVEVALFADILTLKESLEFIQNIHSESDFQLTSCCCPIWIAMIRKVYSELIPHVPGAVSPMVACGRTIKQLYPDAVTVFIGPCIAKKAEAREPDIKDAVDYVLTFREIQDVFDYAGINPADFEEDFRDHSSKAGRIYARTGGVSEAVESTVKRLKPDGGIMVHARQADGVPACRDMLNQIKAGTVDANFWEGMGCVGGCVGGPKALIPCDEGRKHVNDYGEDATYSTPIDNPYVIELLHRLGFDTVESLLENSDIFTRKF